MLDQTLDWILQWGQQPATLAWAVFFATFILEDLAIATAAVLCVQGYLGIPAALVALFMGIVLGDLGLYYLGRLARQFDWARRFLQWRGVSNTASWLEKNQFSTLFTSRFVPGMRLPVYTLAGLCHLSMKRFLLIIVGANTLWVPFLFSLIVLLGEVVFAHFQQWRWVLWLLIPLCVFVLPRVLRHLWASKSPV